MAHPTAILRDHISHQLSQLPADESLEIDRLKHHLEMMAISDWEKTEALLVAPFLFSPPLLQAKEVEVAQPVDSRTPRLDGPYWHVSIFNDQLSPVSGEMEDSQRFERLAAVLSIEKLPIVSPSRRLDAIFYQVSRRSSVGGAERAPYRAALNDLKQIWQQTRREVIVLVPPPTIAVDPWSGRSAGRSNQAEYKAFEMAVASLGYRIEICESASIAPYDRGSTLATYSTRNAVSALLAGMSVAVLDPLSPLRAYCKDTFVSFCNGNNLLDVAHRDKLLNSIAYSQWSFDEIENGSMLRFFKDSLLRKASDIKESLKNSARLDSRHREIRGLKRLANVGGRELVVDAAFSEERDYLIWAKGAGGTDAIAMDLWTLSYSVLSDDCVCIAGAAIGFSSLVAVAAGAAEVFAFEPDKELASRLALLEDHAIQAMPFALGCHKHEARLLRSARSVQGAALETSVRHLEEFSHGHSLGPFLDSPTVEGGDTNMRVPVRRLDDICKDFEFDVILIDSNGSAYQILQGAVGVFERRPPRVVITVLDKTEESLVMPWLANYYQSRARVEAGSGDWCRLLSGRLEDCGLSMPRYWVFYNEEIFPCDDCWAPHSRPRSVEWSSEQLIDTSETIAVVPIGRFGPLSVLH